MTYQIFRNTVVHDIANLWPIYAAIRAYLKTVLRNFALYNFGWRIDFYPLEEDWPTLGLHNILNGINIAKQWPMYAAIRVYLKNYILRNFA